MKRVLYAAIIAVLLTGCSAEPEQNPKPVPEPAKPPVEQAVQPDREEIDSTMIENPFDARKVKVGDKVLGLTVTSMETDSIVEGDYDAYVDFGGEVTVSGTYKHHKDDEFLDHEISFRVDEASAAKLPKLAHDQREVWFMFTNHDEAEKLFGPPGSEGNAEVTIKNYSIKYAHTEIWNTAELIRGEKK